MFFLISFIIIFLPWNLKPWSVILSHTCCGWFMYAVYLALILFFLFFSEISPTWFAIILVLVSLNNLPRKPLRAVHTFQVLRCLELSTEFLTQPHKSYAEINSSFLHDFMLWCKQAKILLTIVPWEALNEFICKLLFTVTPRYRILKFRLILSYMKGLKFPESHTFT